MKDILINGSCLQCGDPAFLLNTTIECSNFECKHFDAILACALMEDPKFPVKEEFSGYYWAANIVLKKNQELKDDVKIGLPKGDDNYDRKILIKYGVSGVYSKDGAGYFVSANIDPGGNILNLIDKDRKKS